jgi:hypothetical protein
MRKEVEYKTDKLRWREYTHLTPEKVKELIQEKLKRATLLAESNRKLIERSKSM